MSGKNRKRLELEHAQHPSQKHGIHPTIWHAIGCHEGFRKLGFLADEIFVHLNPGNSPDMLVVLKTQGKEFSITVGFIEGMTRDVWQQKWNEAVAWANTTKDLDALNDCWTESVTFQKSATFIHALIRKGIEIPNTSRSQLN